MERSQAVRRHEGDHDRHALPVRARIESRPQSLVGLRESGDRQRVEGDLLLASRLELRSGAAGLGRTRGRGRARRTTPGLDEDGHGLLRLPRQERLGRREARPDPLGGAEQALDDGPARLSRELRQHEHQVVQDPVVLRRAEALERRRHRERGVERRQASGRRVRRVVPASRDLDQQRGLAPSQHLLVPGADPGHEVPVLRAADLGQRLAPPVRPQGPRRQAMEGCVGNLVHPHHVPGASVLPPARVEAVEPARVGDVAQRGDEGRHRRHADRDEVVLRRGRRLRTPDLTDRREPRDEVGDPLGLGGRRAGRGAAREVRLEVPRDPTQVRGRPRAAALGLRRVPLERAAQPLGLAGEVLPREGLDLEVVLPCRPRLGGHGGAHGGVVGGRLRARGPAPVRGARALLQGQVAQRAREVLPPPGRARAREHQHPPGLVGMRPAVRAEGVLAPAPEAAVHAERPARREPLRHERLEAGGAHAHALPGLIRDGLGRERGRRQVGQEHARRARGLRDPEAVLHLRLGVPHDALRPEAGGHPHERQAPDIRVPERVPPEEELAVLGAQAAVRGVGLARRGARERGSRKDGQGEHRGNREQRGNQEHRGEQAMAHGGGVPRGPARRVRRWGRREGPPPSAALPLFRHVGASHGTGIPPGDRRRGAAWGGPAQSRRPLRSGSTEPRAHGEGARTEEDASRRGEHGASCPFREVTSTDALLAASTWSDGRGRVSKLR